MTNTTEDRESGKRFIANLKATIDAVEVYAPTGKYGKKELDKSATREEKMEKLLLATPDTPYEVLEYVLFCKSLGAVKSKSTLRHLSTLVERAKMEHHNDPTIKQASTIVRSLKIKRTFLILYSVALLVIGFAIYIWGLNTEWKLAGRIAWGFFGLLIPALCINFMPMLSYQDNLFDK